MGEVGEKRSEVINSGMGQKVAVIVAMVAVLALPFVVRLATGGPELRTSASGADSQRLVIVTPHVEQIRDEFSKAFERWHLRTHGQSVTIDWRTPGGTSEIVKQLEATLDAAARKGQLRDDGTFEPGAAGADLFFGGGSYEHGKMKAERTVKTDDGKTVKFRMGRPIGGKGFDQKRMDEWFGENRIGNQPLYEKDQYWIGTALSGFGIVYNRDVLARLGLPEPRSFQDLRDPRFFNMLCLADGRQSGSVTTTYDSIMNKEMWDRGWRTLRDLCANARYFAAASTKPPVDVGQGEGAAGLAIDFYGRGQAQFLLKPGQDPATVRVGYVDPEGAVFIDADPASMLNGAQNPVLAARFVEFVLSDEGQALWQFPAVGADGSKAAPGTPEDGGGRPMGPEQEQLRRMPARRAMYEEYAQWMIDKTNPFTIASDVTPQNWRDAIPPMMAAFGIDTAPELREAWLAISRARARAAAGTVSPGHLKELEHEFYALPPHTMRDGTVVQFDQRNYEAIKKDTNKWRDPDHGKRSLIAYTEFFRNQYRKVIRMEKEGK